MDIPLVKDETPTAECPLKRYYFGWKNKKGRKRGTLAIYPTAEAAQQAARQHSAAHGGTDYYVAGRVFSGYVTGF